jgi:uncharacterized protein (TIGR02271 family)
MFSNRTSFQTRFPAMTEGQTVYSKNGERLGKITQMGDDVIRIEKGIFFPKDFTCRYDDISDVRDDNVYLNLDASELSEWKEESYAGWNYTEGLNTGSYRAEPRTEFKDRYPDWSTKDLKVPVAEEELEAQKTAREAGSVRLHKIVHTELKHFTVPVMREEVRIDRTPVSDQEAAAKSTAPDAFSEKTIDVPVMEEEVTVTKRPVVKEEVHVSKERITEERDVSGEVRKEEVRVEGEDKLKKRKAG